MRSLGIFSVLLLGTSLSVSSVVAAQNYVAPGDYNNPDVIVNMDVLNNQGMGSPAYPMPVLQQPLRPPVLQRPLPPQYRTPPAPMPAPQMAEPIMSPPMRVAAPIAPVSALPPETPPAPIAMNAPSPILDMPPQPEPFSTEEMAASAPPLPTPKAVPTPAPEARNASIQQSSISDSLIDNYAETPVTDEGMAKPPVKAAKSNSYAEPAVSEIKPVAPVLKAVEPEQKAGRQLLAQAREQAGDGKDAERKVVLFDNVPPAPSPEAPLKTIEKKTSSAVLKPAPVGGLEEPTMAAAPVEPVTEDILKPAALPEPIQQAEKIAAPMPIMPASKTAPSADQQVAMLKPTALPDVAPASIPDSGAMKKAETVVDNFEAYRLLFAQSSSEVKATEREILDNVIGKLKNDENIKLQLRAYASGTPDSSAQARRISLSRALAVRTYLTQQGIAASRLDVRALGMGSPAMGDMAVRADIPPDRVDMVLTR